jgi:curli biogenesis system outer membrane secretion channel CsgG
MRRNLRYLLFIPVFFLWSNTAFSTGVTEITVTGEGTGPTEEIATRNALANAVSQTGLNISINSSLDTSVARSSTEEGNEKLVAQQRRTEKTSLEAEGEIKSWQKIGSSRIEGGLYAVQVKAVVHQFKLGQSAQRMRLALLPIQTNVPNISAEVVRQLESDAQTNLVQSRRFTVLTRSDINRVLGEQRFVATQNVSRGERARLGNLLGADVLLLITIAQASYSERTETIAVTGQRRLVKDGAARINVSIFDVATGQIRFSGAYSSTPSSSVSSLVGLLSAVSSNALADVVQRIYPLRVVQVTSSGEIYLNTGGVRLERGALLDVYEETKPLTDPYTGESLGGVERHVGAIEITRVETRFSVAKVLTGQGFKPLMIARPTPTSATAADVANPEDVSRASKGVTLPFDR